MTENPWDKINNEIEKNNIYNAKVVSTNDNGVNLIINNSYDGLISLNELTWLKKPPHPSKVVEIEQQVEVKIIEIDNEKRRLICKKCYEKQFSKAFHDPIIGILNVIGWEHERKTNIM